MAQDAFDLDRFVRAQDGGTYEQALAELRAGRKRSHWIWFVFPQAAGLGRSQTARFYSIGSKGELKAYVAHPVLMPRLVEAARALLGLPGCDPVAVLGGIDAVKVRSCMTLFELASDEPVFAAVLDKYYRGSRDELTHEIASRF